LSGDIITTYSSVTIS